MDVKGLLCAVLLAASGAMLTGTVEAAADDTLRQELFKIAADDGEVRKAAIARLVLTKDPRLADALRLFQEGSLYVRDGAVFSCPELLEGANGERTGALFDPLTGEPFLAGGTQLVVPQAELRNITPNRRERRVVRNAMLALDLYASDETRRMDAAKSCGGLGLPIFAEPLQDLLENETVPRIRDFAEESSLLIQLRGNDARGQLEAVRRLGELRSRRALPHLIDRVEASKKSPGESALALDGSAQRAYEAAIAQIEKHQSWMRGFDHFFAGISLGSILILMALGLSITFGLMGVINMAHGELMMIGAYTTYEVQCLFTAYLPEAAFDWYFALALPAAFVCAGIFGFLIEFLVVRHLYGRPLETLLATWGVGLVLIQLVRLIYGNNIGVNSPTWLRGGAEVMHDFVLPYNRCFILLLCGVCLTLTYGLLRRTTLGLMVRATTQNREMADSLGVNTRRIDSCTFALGAGLAGIAGCALTLIGGVTPDMGQNYIVDSFLVVVTGGVGELVGVVASGFGMGLLTKTLEPFVETVWARVLILVCVIAFIQWRPAGLFPPKGRLADV